MVSSAFARWGRRSLPVLASALACLPATAAAAQDHHAPSPAPSVQGADAASPLKSDLVKTGLYLITGGGGNVLLRFSANGLILVDAKQPGNHRALMSQVRKISKISDLPVRVLVVTNHHADRIGNYAQIAAAGAAVIAQENAKQYLPIESRREGRQAPPLVTYERNYTLRLGGVEAQLMHFGSAQTDNDAVVYFPDLKVVAVGDLFTPEPPVPDFAGGGSLVGWSLALRQVLKLDFDVVVPSKGPLVTRADLEAFTTRVDTLVSRLSLLVNQGGGKDHLLTQLKSGDLGWQLDFTNEQLDRLHAELSRLKGP